MAQEERRTNARMHDKREKNRHWGTSREADGGYKF